ncbi:DUF4450 domain-containing protein [Flavobacterium sp. GT2N3]|uniref:DUF4450 domain-containing protein n=1 Tax=unclassified Flavobacterium TaxID=196869 RepID=UPI003AACC245
MKIEKLPVQILICVFFLCAVATFGQEKNRVDQVRKIHYAPEGNSFVLKNGTRKFNRTLYGTNTGFRVEIGDLPEFALYMLAMGGNFKLGIQKEKNSKWITEANAIDTQYSLGIMYYKIQDPILRNELLLEVTALKDKEGFALKVTGNNILKDVSLIWVFGGASGKKFSRDGDIGADPESVFYLQPNYCINNKYALQKNSFLLEYGSETNKQKTGNNRNLTGFYPKSETHLSNANKQNLPLELYRSTPDSLTVTNGKINSIPKSGLFWMIETNTKILKLVADRTRLFHGWFGFYDRCHKTTKSVLEIRNHFQNFRRFQTHKRIQQLWCRLCCSNNLGFALEQKKTLKNITLKTIANDVLIGLMSATHIR